MKFLDGEIKAYVDVKFYMPFDMKTIDLVVEVEGQKLVKNNLKYGKKFFTLAKDFDGNYKIVGVQATIKAGGNCYDKAVASGKYEEVALILF